MLSESSLTSSPSFRLEGDRAVGLFREASDKTEGEPPFAPIEIAGTTSYDNAAFERLWERRTAIRREATTIVRLHDSPSDLSAVARRAVGQDADLGWGRYTWRVLWAPPLHWRDELTWPEGQTDVAIVRPEVRMIYLAAQKTLYASEPLSYRNDLDVSPAPPGIFELPTLENRFAAFPLVRPPFPATEWDFLTLEEAAPHNGRTTRRVRATRIANSPAARERLPSGFWPGVDEYECLVDDSRRIVMRLTGIVDETPVAILAVDGVRTNVSLRPDQFDFDPPAGTRIVHVRRAE